MTKIKFEIRTLTNKKGLIERRLDLVAEMEKLMSKVEEEHRTLNVDEKSTYADLKKEIEEIDETLKLQEESRSLSEPINNKNGNDNKKNKKKKKIKNEEDEEEEVEEDDSEARALFMGEEGEETRAAMNTTVNADGGFVVKSTLSKDIIKEIKDRSDVYKFFDHSNLSGDIKVPKVKNSNGAKWVKENPEDGDLPAATTPKISLVTLKQHRLYRESALTQQMINSQEINLNTVIKEDIAENMVDAIEEAIFYGSGEDEPTGLIDAIVEGRKVEIAAANKLDINDLKKAKFKIKKKLWKTCKWFMHSDTLLEVDLLKDDNGRPLLQPNITKESDYTILGIPVEVSDSIKTMETATEGEPFIIFAEKKAYRTNTQKQIALYIYEDSFYKKRGLTGYGCDVYMDGKTVDEDRVAGIVNKATLRGRGKGKETLSEVDLEKGSEANES